MKIFLTLFFIVGITTFTLYLVHKHIMTDKQPEAKKVQPKINIPNDQQIKEALKIIKVQYGLKTAQDVERLFRNETAHFKSGGFLKSLSPGMEKHSDKFPYGYTSLMPFWTLHPSFAPNGFSVMKENNSAIAKSKGEKTFLTFQDIIHPMLAVAEYSKVYPIERWGGTTPEIMKKYRSILDSISPKFVNSLT